MPHALRHRIQRFFVIAPALRTVAGADAVLPLVAAQQTAMTPAARAHATFRHSRRYEAEVQRTSLPELDVESQAAYCARAVGLRSRPAPSQCEPIVTIG